MSRAILGIDIAKEKFDVALTVNEQLSEGRFDNNEQGFDKLLRWLKKQRAGQVHACLEATGRYGDELALFLHEAGHVVSIINPSRIKAYAQSQLRRNKTDRLDARLIMDFCARQEPAPWTPPPPEQRELQALSRHLSALHKSRQQEVNRLGSGVPSPLVVQSLQEHIAFLDQQIARLEQLIEEHIDRHPPLREQRDLIASIRGIGDRTANRILAEVPDILAFGSARQLAAYAGLTPSQRQSGKSINGRPRLSKTGNANLRAYLYMPAVASLRWNPIIRQMRERMLAQGKSKMCIVGAAMRRLLHLVYGVLKSGRPFDPEYLSRTQAQA